MRVIAALGLALMLTVSGVAQTTTSTYFDGGSFVDSAGNLYVFDYGRSTTGITITGQRHSFYAPKTRITVQRVGTGNTQTVEYDGSLRVIGVGNGAVYAIATAFTVSGTTLTTADSLIAIKSTLPAGPALSGFPSFSLTSGIDARVGPADYISLVTEPDRSPSSTTTTTARTAKVLHFNGSGFEVVSSGTLP